MNSNNRIGGFTLVELLITLAIVSVIATFALPSMDRLVKNAQRHTAVSDMIALVNLARNSAIMEQTTVTVCPLDENDECANDWSDEITVFRDPEANKTLDDAGQIIRIVHPSQGGQWIANTSSRPYFRFMSTGIANYAIGNMIWCPANGDMTIARQIVVNRGGRVRQSIDQDGDGIVEDSNGTPIQCN